MRATPTTTECERQGPESRSGPDSRNIFQQGNTEMDRQKDFIRPELGAPTSTADLQEQNAYYKSLKYTVIQENLTALRTAMQDNGIENLVVTFAGADDEGIVESIFADENEVMGEPGFPDVTTGSVISTDRARIISIGTESRSVAFTEAVEEVAYAILEDRYAGWEINEGSYGNIMIPANGRPSMEFTEYRPVTEYEDIEYGMEP